MRRSAQMSLSSLYRWVAVRATARALALAVLLWIVSALGIVALHSRVGALSGGFSVPDVDPFYGPTELYALLEQYPVPARRAFLTFTIYDIYYAFVAYSVASLALVSLTRPVIHAHPRLVWILAVPLAGLAVELLEQACFLAVLTLLPAKLTSLAFAASVLTPLKFALILVLVSSLLALGFWRVAYLARRPTRRCS